MNAMPTLILIKSPGSTGASETHILKAQEVILGREDKCGIVVPNHAVSRQHSKIIIKNGEFFIEDLNSRNGTFVNNRAITAPHHLKHDDRIKICDFQYLYQDEKAVAAAKPRLKLPREFGPGEVEPEENSDGTDVADMSNVESTVAVRPTAELLGAQPNDKLRALLDISVALSKANELDPLLNVIADSILGVFRQADRCFIILSEGTKLIPRVVKARRSTPGDDHRFSKTIVRKCMESQTAYLSEDASSDAAMGAAQSIAEFRIRSVMCVPLVSTEGVAIGALQLDTQDRSKKFREDDLKMLLIVANLASVAIEKATYQENNMAREKQQNEIEIAKKVQLGFLPKDMPVAKGYEFYAVYSAAQTVGGDYYDLITLPDGRIAIMLGDVAGKGVPASLLMAKLSAEARYCILTQPSLAAAVNLLNEQLIRGGIGDRFVTMAAIILNPMTHKVVLVNAGHINPNRFRLLDKSFDEVITNDLSGLPLGLVTGFEYQSVEFDLNEGDNILLFTDGVSDAMSPAGDMFEMIGVTKAIFDPSPMGPANRPATIGDRLITSVRKHANGRPQNDDIAIACFGRLTAELAATGSHEVPKLTNGK